MALLALALITATVVAAFSATNAETIANNAMRAQDHAYQLAEAGLQQFLQRRNESGFCTNCVTNPPPTDSEWTRVSLPGGYATVVATRLRAPKADGTPGLFLVRSTGVDTMVRLSGAGRLVFASRTVGMYATFGTAAMRSLAAFTSLNGITNNGSVPGSQVGIMGSDGCWSGDRAGVVVPPGGFTGTGESPEGSPDVDASMTADSIGRAIGVDWTAIKLHDAIPADYTIPPSGWPSPSAFNNWPVIRIRGNYTMVGDGRGLLIVDGDLTIPSNYDWDGIILVGGRLTTTGTGTITGAIVTGLNRVLPGAPPDIGAGDNDLNTYRTKIRYNSCRVERAAQRLDVYFALINTWMDNVAVW